MDLDALTTLEAATIWAYQTLTAKNSLTAADAGRVEEAFQTKLTTLAGSDADTAAASCSPSEAGITPSSGNSRAEKASEHTAAEGIDKSQLTLPEPRRIRNKEHVRFVAQQACLVCGRRPSDPHHLRHLQPRALGRKSSDEFTVPLCRIHHRALHRAGDERDWWNDIGIDPRKVARALWKKSRLDNGSLRSEPGSQGDGAKCARNASEAPT